MFKIEDYDKKAPFTSFLPGIAGPIGLPIWTFYVNRGQGICSFGYDNKSNSIMPFKPAILAYENTAFEGFRTFLRVKYPNGEVINVEPFAEDENRFSKEMLIEQNSLMVTAVSEKLGISINVKYFIIPNDNIGGLVRRVEIKNLNSHDLEIEALDGMPRLIAAGIETESYNNMANLSRSFVTMTNTANKIPVFTVGSSTEDSDRVDKLEGGIYSSIRVNNEIVMPIYDPWKIFGEWKNLSVPRLFWKGGLKSILESNQIIENKFPSVFAPVQQKVSPNECIQIESIFGYTSNLDQLNYKVTEENFGSKEYIDNKEKEAKELVDSIVSDVDMKSKYPMFDEYIKQSYLDNILRGGYPFEIEVGGEKEFLHIYSRKHGDPERDYNFFSTPMRFYSEGNGNFRDVVQNRRNDIFFNPKLGVKSLIQFLNLIQADGYNPLQIQGSILKIKEDKLDQVKEYFANIDDSVKFILDDFNFEEFYYSDLEKIRKENESFADYILENSEMLNKTKYSEGYWIDHWVYLLDLLENANKIFPDKKADYLFDNDVISFYQSGYFVKRRNDKYVLSNDNVRQYSSLFKDDDLIDTNGPFGGVLKDEDGNIYKTSIYSKLFILALVKFLSLDQFSMGISMEAGKPGWNDALNGLPGLFGSSIAETLELVRLVRYLLSEIENFENIYVPHDVWIALEKVDSMLKHFNSSTENEVELLKFWDDRLTILEEYRENTNYSIRGEDQKISSESVNDILQRIEKILNDGVHRSEKYGEAGVIPTFLTYTATDYTVQKDDNGNPIKNPDDLILVKVSEFEPKAIPLFLEAPAKAMKVFDTETANNLYQDVLNSELFDKKVGMYKTSVPLDNESIEIGRIRSFTPGWQERESIFMHMHYKYIYGILLSKQYDNFYKEFPRAILPFRDEVEYGRSILEHSSFIASSVNPDESIVGRGFVARLSGSTAEALSIWLSLIVGEKWFSINDDDELMFEFDPILNGDLFAENGEFAYKLFSKTNVKYINPKRLNTYKGTTANAKISHMIIRIDSEEIKVNGNKIVGDLCRRLREQEIDSIEVYFE